MAKTLPADAAALANPRTASALPAPMVMLFPGCAAVRTNWLFTTLALNAFAPVKPAAAVLELMSAATWAAVRLVPPASVTEPVLAPTVNVKVSLTPVTGVSALELTVLIRFCAPATPV